MQWYLLDITSLIAFADAPVGISFCGSVTGYNSIASGTRCVKVVFKNMVPLLKAVITVQKNSSRKRDSTRLNLLLWCISSVYCAASTIVGITELTPATGDDLSSVIYRYPVVVLLQSGANWAPQTRDTTFLILIIKVLIIGRFKRLNARVQHQNR
jgi:hypothetical protein